MFRINARAVLELGSELISSDIIAFYELIKNGFDARSTNGVEVRFDIVMPRHLGKAFGERLSKLSTFIGPHSFDVLAAVKAEIAQQVLADASPAARSRFEELVSAAGTLVELEAALPRAIGECNTILVSDRGTGMSEDDLRQAFLVIGTPSRKREVDLALGAGAATAPYLGEKGLGRLSAMRLGERLRVITAKKTDISLNELDIDWRSFADIDAMLDEVPVEPKKGKAKASGEWSGTMILISELLENWSESRVKEMAEYEFARLTDPFRNPEDRPRTALFWNDNRTPIPMMPKRLLGAAHARITGQYRIDDGKPHLTLIAEVLDLDFEHPPETEAVTLGPEELEGIVVGKEWEVEDSALVSVGPFSFEAHWFNRRRLSRVDSTGENKALRDLQDQWSGILLFRDGYRVFPYGDEDDDWLELDRRALRRSGYTLNKTQFVGRVSISRAFNPQLVDQTNREGLRVTPEQKVFLKVIQYAIQDRLGGFMRFVERQYKGQKVDLSEAKTKVSTLQDRAKSAIKRLRKVAPVESNEAVDELQQTLMELSEFAEKARERIAEVEKESRQMVDMAGVGLMVEVVAHELARSSESALKALEGLKAADVPDRFRSQLNTLRAEMKSLSKRIRILDPLSVSGRQRTEAFSLGDLLKDIVDAHEAQFDRHNVRLALDLGERPLHVRAVKGMVVQILENLISNSIHWMDVRAERETGYRPTISISLERSPPTITFEDNGRGIAPDNAERVFQPFFSLKDAKSRRGLGLFIAREAAQHHGGSLILSDHENADTGRLHRFVLELPEGVQI